MCTMLTKLGRQMMKKVAILLCIVLEFFQSGGRFWCGGGFWVLRDGFLFCFCLLYASTAAVVVCDENHFSKISERIKMHFSQNGNFARDFSKISISYFLSIAFAKLLLNKNDTSFPFALPPLNSRDNLIIKQSTHRYTKQKQGEIQQWLGIL